MGRTTYQLGRPGFIADSSSIDRLDGRQIDWDNVSETYCETPGFYVTLSAAASADAVALSVDALEGDVAAGTLLHFGESKEFARVTAAASAGATSLTVEAIPTALEDGDSAFVHGSGPKKLPAGTVVGDTLGSGKISPRVATTNTAMGILETDAHEDSTAAAKSGYGVIVGGVIYEALLPDAVSGSLASAIKTELAAAGTGFVFASYSDSRAS